MKLFSHRPPGLHKRMGFSMGWTALLLGALCLCSACRETPNALLVVVTCLDQNGNPLPPGVSVSVDGVSEIWTGEPLRFPVKVDGAIELVAVKAGAGGNYRYSSIPQYDVRPGTVREVELRFFKPYTVTVEALGRNQVRLAAVNVFANGKHLGATDERGLFVWRIDRPSTPAGQARPGSRFVFTLERNGEWAKADSIYIAEAQFAYTSAAQLDQDRVWPLASSEADDTTRDIQELAVSPPPTKPARKRVVNAPTRTPPRATPVATKVQPEPPVLEIPRSEPATSPTSDDLLKGHEAFAAGRHEEALRFYSRVPPDNPDYTRALQKIGEIHFETRNYEGAIAAYEAILQNDPSEYAAYNNLAVIYLATESYDEALDNLDNVLARKHLIPREKRREAELSVRYQRAYIHYVQFQNERD
ncbi:MAG: tetratricopeptide repeat protein, partial [Rhodothermales bacterium]